MHEQLTAATRIRAMLRSGEAKRLRLAAGASLSEIGAAVVDPDAGIRGVTASTVHRWERGERTPRGAHAAAYWRALEALREGMAA